MLDITTDASGADDTASRHVIIGVPTAAPGDTAADILAQLRKTSFETVESVYVLDAQGHLQGRVPIRRLLVAPAEQSLDGLMDRDVPHVAPEADQEAVASLALANEMTAVPVLDEQQRFIGVVAHHALLQILRREHFEDMNRLVGILKSGEQAREAIEGAIHHRVLHRLPWLLIGLVGSMLATWLMAGFEETLRERVTVAFFIPAVVYLADAIGTQTEAVAVRGLTFRHAPLWRLLVGELGTGLVIGVLLGLVIFPAVAFVFNDSRLAFAVSSAVVVAGVSASSIGLLLPWLLAWLGKDPAFGSGPVATILQDLLSLLTYFVTVALVLR
ncbi:MAG: magnesium transporter [Gammaproteobacteria bacterium]|jgi:magnesium transporter